MNLADLEIRLSGGAGNTDPDASLGGVMSSEKVLSQLANKGSNILGVTIDYACGNALGSGTLSFIYASLTLQWTPYGGSSGALIDVSADGKYIISDSTTRQQLYVTVVAASLANSDQTDIVIITNIANETFDDISKTENIAGDTEYRCFYITNTHATDTAYSVTIWLESDASGADTLEIGKDLAGVGDGVATGVADTVADEDTAPDPAVTFLTPATRGTGINLGDFPAGNGAAFWIKRTKTAGESAEKLTDLSAIGFATDI